MPSVAAKLASLASKTPKTVKDSPCLECLLCAKRHSREDVRNGRYWPQTMVCSVCYVKMQAAPYRKSCFGKPTVLEPISEFIQVIVEKGYHPEAEECSRLCPDREPCALALGIVIYA